MQANQKQKELLLLFFVPRVVAHVQKAKLSCVVRALAHYYYYMSASSRPNTRIVSVSNVSSSYTTCAAMFAGSIVLKVLQKNKSASGGSTLNGP